MNYFWIENIIFHTNRQLQLMDGFFPPEHKAEHKSGTNSSRTDSTEHEENKQGRSLITRANLEIDRLSNKEQQPLSAQHLLMSFLCFRGCGRYVKPSPHLAHVNKINQAEKARTKRASQQCGKFGSK